MRHLILTMLLICAGVPLLLSAAAPQDTPWDAAWVSPDGGMAVTLGAAAGPDYYTDETSPGTAGVGKPDISIEWTSGGLRMSAHFYRKSKEKYSDFVARVAEAKKLLLDAFPKDPGTS